MIPRSPWKPARLFLTVLSFFPFFQAPCFSAEALAPPKPAPAYMLQTRVEYPPDPALGARIFTVFTVGSKKLWSHRQPSALSAAVIIPETGRCFLELGSAPSVELRVYTRHGIQLLDQKILPRAVSFDGGLIAYDNSADGNSGPVTTYVLDLDHGASKRKFILGPGFRAMALSGNGKDLLVWNGKTDLSLSAYALLGERGKPIWGMAGPVKFLALGSKGAWLLWKDQKKSSVLCTDFKTGKTVREFPAKIFDMLYKRLPEFRAFP